MGKMKKEDNFFYSTQPHNMLHSLIFRELGYFTDQKKNTRALTSVAERNLVLKTFKELKCDLPGFPKATFLMVFSPDGTKVASTHGNHYVYITELATGKHIRTLNGHRRTPWCIAFHPSCSQILASGCLGGQVRVWDLNGPCKVWNVKSQIGIASLAFHPSKTLLVIATNNKIYFWDWSRPKPYAFASTTTDKEKVRYVAFDNLGTKLITGIANLNPCERSADRSLPRRVLRYPSIDVLDKLPRVHLWNHGSTYGIDMPHNYAERTTHPILGEQENPSHACNRNTKHNIDRAARRLTRSRLHMDDSEDEDDDFRRRQRRWLELCSSSSSSTGESSSSSGKGYSRSVDQSRISNFNISSLCHSSMPNISRPIIQLPTPPTLHLSNESPAQNTLDENEINLQRINENESEPLSRPTEDINNLIETGNSDEHYSEEISSVPRDPPDENTNEQSENGYWLLEENSNLDSSTENASTSTNDNTRHCTSRWIPLDSSNRNTEHTRNIFFDPSGGIYDLLEVYTMNRSSAGMVDRMLGNILEAQEIRNKTHLDWLIIEIGQIRRMWERLQARNTRKLISIARDADLNGNSSPEPSTSSKTPSFHPSRGIRQWMRLNRTRSYFKRKHSSITTGLLLNWMPTLPKIALPSRSMKREKSDHQNQPSTSRGPTTSTDSFCSSNFQHSEGASDRCLHSLLALLQDDEELRKLVSLYLAEIVDALCSRYHNRRENLHSTRASSATNDHTYSSPRNSTTSPDEDPTSENNNQTEPTTNSEELPESSTPATNSTTPRCDLYTLKYHNFQYEKKQIAMIMQLKILSNCDHRRDDNTGPFLHPGTALRAARALSLIGQSLMQFFDLNQSPTNFQIFVYMHRLFQIALDLTHLLKTQAERELRKLTNDNQTNHVRDHSQADGNELQPSRNANRSNSEILPSFNAFEILSYRLQAWDFTKGDLPKIIDREKNLIVRECNIHNDASINISADGRLLTTMTTVRVSRATNVGIYSLDWDTLGDRLGSRRIVDAAVSVSFSPLQQHLLVGLARVHVDGDYVMARIYKLKGKDQNLQEPSLTQHDSLLMKDMRRLCPTDCHSTGPFSLNCIRWAPQPGQGLVYATNTGELNILH